MMQSKYDPSEFSFEEIRDNLQQVSDIRDQAMLALQLKLGLRTDELVHLSVSDVTLADDPQTASAQLGTQPELDGLKNAVYVSNSKCPRILPLDDEARQLLKAYLSNRSSTDKWFFTSKRGHGKARPNSVENRWSPEFENQWSDVQPQLTSLDIRRWFVRYWMTNQGMDQELVSLLIGSPMAKECYEGPRAAYRELKDPYLQNVFELGV